MKDEIKPGDRVTLNAETIKYRAEYWPGAAPRTAGTVVGESARGTYWIKWDNIKTREHWLKEVVVKIDEI